MSGLEPLLLPLLTPLAGAVGKLAFIGLRKCYEKYKQYKEEKKKEQQTENATDAIESALQSIEQEVDRRYDQLAVLGPKFVRGDFQARRDLYDINRKGKVFDIQQKISELYTHLPGTDPPISLQGLQSLQHSIKLAGEDIIGALENWAFRLVSEKWPYRMVPRIHKPEELLTYIEKIPTSFPAEQQALYYCDGAVALQHNPKSTIHEISTPGRTDLPLTWTCKFCFLEVSDYRRAAMAWDLGVWNSLGMSHVVACVLYTDRRAAFKCIDCDGLELRKIYSDPAAFIQHIRVHQDERQQARMNKSSTYKRDAVPDRTTLISAYETESSLDRRKPRFADSDPEGEKLERDISKELGEEVSDDSQDEETPSVFESHKKVPMAISELGSEQGGGGSETDEDVSSVSSNEYQQRWGDGQSPTILPRTLPTYTEAVGASHSQNARQEGKVPGTLKGNAPSPDSDVKTRPMANEGIQPELFHLREAEQDVQKASKKPVASNTTVQQRPDLPESPANPFSLPSLYNERFEKELLHEMGPTKTERSSSAAMTGPQSRAESVGAVEEEKLQRDDAKAETRMGRRDWPTVAANADLKALNATTMGAGVIPELATAKGSDLKTIPSTSTSTSGPTPASRAERTEIAIPAYDVTIRGGQAQAKDQLFKTQDLPPRAISRPSGTPSDTPTAIAPTAQVTVLFNFRAREPRELSVDAGDVLDIVRKRDSNWWLCLDPRNRASGYVPTTYVQELPPTRPEKVREQEQAQPQTQGQPQTPSPARQKATPQPDETKVGVGRKPIPGSLA